MVNPIKHGLKQIRIELAMLNFCPGAKQALPATVLLSSVLICKEICLITVGLTEVNLATVLAGWLS